MNVVVPMAGRGSRLEERGGDLPKPLIPVLGRPMIEWALRTLEGCRVDRLVFVALEEHVEAYDLESMLPSLPRFETRQIEIVGIPEVTEGQLCTVLEARSFIDRDEPVLVASSDTYVVSDLQADIDALPSESRGLISVIDLPGDRWSFAKTDETGRVVDVAEKERISPHASTGLYYFSSGGEFVRAAEKMIREKRKTRGEYYVMPLYQDYLEKGWRLDTSQASEMWDMGTPEALTRFEGHWRERTESDRTASEEAS